MCVELVYRFVECAMVMDEILIVNQVNRAYRLPRSKWLVGIVRELIFTVLITLSRLRG